MSRRSKIACFTLLLLLVGVAGWGTVQRQRREAWAAELRRQGVHATTEQLYDAQSDRLLDVCWSLYAGECVQVLVDNEADAQVLLSASSCPGRLQILTFLDLPAESFGILQDQFPMADMVALVPKEVFEQESAVITPPTAMPITRAVKPKAMPAVAP